PATRRASSSAGASSSAANAREARWGQDEARVSSRGGATASGEGAKYNARASRNRRDSGRFEGAGLTSRGARASPAPTSPLIRSATPSTGGTYAGSGSHPHR